MPKKKMGKDEAPSRSSSHDDEEKSSSKGRNKEKGEGKKEKGRKGNKEKGEPLRTDDGVWRAATKAEACGRKPRDSGGKGFFGDLSLEQFDRLQELKKELQTDFAKTYTWAPKVYHDVLLVRYLRARDFVVADAAEMLRASFVWRNELFSESGYSREAFLDWVVKRPMQQKIMQYWPFTFHGVDLDPDVEEDARMPVAWERLTETHAKSFCSLVSQHDALLFHVYQQETVELQRDTRMLKVQKFLDRELQSCFIQDIRSLGMAHFHRPALDLVSSIAHVDDNHYPESLKLLYVVGVGRLFAMFWKVLKHSFDPDTRDKMDFIRSDSTALAKLSELVGAENIPAGYLPGSKCGDPTHDGDACMPKGGVFVLDIEGGEMSSEEEGFDAPTLSIAAGSSAQEEVHVKRKGSEVAWQVFVDGYDVDFSILFESEKGEEAELVEDFGRIDNLEDDALAGNLVAERAGTYHFKFDNSFSWTRSKVVSLSVGVTDPPPPKKTTTRKKQGRKNGKKGNKGGRRN